MGIGKTMCVLLCFMIAVTAMVTMFSVAITDKSDADVYTNTTNTINGTTELTQSITGTGTNFLMAMILIVAILFFFAVIMIFRKK